MKVAWGAEVGRRLRATKAVTETEKARDGDAPRAQTTTAHQRRNTQDDKEGKEEVNQRMPESFDFAFGDHGSGDALEMLGMGTVDLFDVIGMLETFGGGCTRW